MDTILSKTLHGIWDLGGTMQGFRSTAGFQLSPEVFALKNTTPQVCWINFWKSCTIKRKGHADIARAFWTRQIIRTTVSTKIENVTLKFFFFQSKWRLSFTRGTNWHPQWRLQHLDGKKPKLNLILGIRRSFHTFTWVKHCHFLQQIFSYLKEGEIRDMTSKCFIFL